MSRMNWDRCRSNGNRGYNVNDTINRLDSKKPKSFKKRHRKSSGFTLSDWKKLIQ